MLFVCLDFTSCTNCLWNKLNLKWVLKTGLQHGAAWVTLFPGRHFALVKYCFNRYMNVVNCRFLTIELRVFTPFSLIVVQVHYVAEKQ